MLLLSVQTEDRYKMEKKDVQFLGICNITQKKRICKQKRRVCTMAVSKIVRQTISEREKREKVLFRLEVENGLKRLGFMPDLAGFRYLAMAIELWVDEIGPDAEGLPPQITKTIYPRIAELTGKRWGAIERSCRWSIQQAMDCDRVREQMIRRFGIEPKNGARYYTPAQFVALFVQQMFYYRGIPPAA